MTSRHEDLREELVAILGAGRELTPEVDHQLADAFLRALDQAAEPTPEQALHQPHYSLLLAGGAWGAALMFLLCGLMFGHPTASQFIVVAVIALSLVAVTTRSLLYLARHDWQLPHIRLIPQGSVQNGRR